MDYAEHAKYTKYTLQATPVSNEQTNVRLTYYYYSILLFITLNILKIPYGIITYLRMLIIYNFKRIKNTIYSARYAYYL